MGERTKVFWHKLWDWRCVGFGVGKDGEYSVAVYLWKWMIGISYTPKKYKKAVVMAEDLVKYDAQGGRKGF